MILNQITEGMSLRLSKMMGCVLWGEFKHLQYLPVPFL